MGLAVSVGFLADMKHNDSEGYEWAQQMFATTNEFLASEGVDGWAEPEDLPDGLGMRTHVGSFPYSFLHYLRRAYALQYEGQEVTPTGEAGLTDADDLIIADASSMMSSHLLCHSDCEGLYVPIDFVDPLFDLDGFGVPGGGMLGSSHALRRELQEVAPHIGISLTNGELSDAEATRIYEEPAQRIHEWEREYVVFGALWEAATASIRHHTAIVFT